MTKHFFSCLPTLALPSSYYTDLPDVISWSSFSEMKSSILEDMEELYDHLETWFVPLFIYEDPPWIQCYNATQDGWDPMIFHSKCDHRKHTLVLARNDWEIFGGYSEQPWNKSK